MRASPLLRDSGFRAGPQDQGQFEIIAATDPRQHRERRPRPSGISMIYSEK
jgi:hypothetical protein